MGREEHTFDPSVARRKDADRSTTKAYLIGGGIGSLAAAAFMIRDGGIPGGNITIMAE
jgi:oleate hydratase